MQFCNLQFLQVPPQCLEQPGAECEAAPEGCQRQQAGAGCQSDRQEPLPATRLIDPRLEPIERDITAEECHCADNHYHQWEDDRQVHATSGTLRTKRAGNMNVAATCYGRMRRRMAVSRS